MVHFTEFAKHPTVSGQGVIAGGALVFPEAGGIG